MRRLRTGYVQADGAIDPTFMHLFCAVSLPFLPTVSRRTTPIWFALRTRISSVAPSLRR